MSTDVNKASIILDAEDRTRAAFNSLRNNLRGVQTESLSVQSVLRGLIPAVTLGGLAAFVKSSIDMQDELSKMSQKTGVAVETLAGLKHAADLSDVELDQLAKGVRTFSVIVQEAARGQQSYQDKLALLGLSYKALKDLSPEEQFYALADAVGKLGQQDRAATVANTLGDRLSVLVPLLSDGSAGLRKMVQEGKALIPVTEESAKQAEEFNDNLTRLKASAGRFGIEVANPVLGPLVEITNAMTASSDGASHLASSFGEVLVTVFQTVGVLGANVAYVFKEVGNEIGGMAAQIVALSHLDIKSFKFIGDTMKEDARKAREELDALEQRLLSFGKRAAVAQSSPDGGVGDAEKISACARDGGTWDGKQCVKKPKSSPRAADPLASLLGSTDIGRTKEYEKLLALLDARFDHGRKNAELYAQAVAQLNHQFGREQIDPLGSGSFKTTSQDTAEFIRQQQDAINGMNSEISQDAIKAANDYEAALQSLVSDTTLAKTEQLQQNIAILDKGLFDGKIGAEQHAEALKKLTEGAAAANDKLGAMDEFAKSAAQNIQSAFADFLFDPFDKGLRGMIDGFAKTMQRIIAEAVAADLAKRMFGDLVDGGKGKGWVGTALEAIGAIFTKKSANGNVFLNAPALSAYSGSVVSRPTVFPFASGIGIMGEAGPEAILPLKRGADGKLGVRSAQGGGHTVIVNINGANNAPDVRNAAGQVARSVLGAIKGSQRYG